MTLSKEGLEAAHAAYERYGQKGDLRSQRLSDGCLSTVITAYLASLPTPDGLEVVAWAWLDAGDRLQTTPHSKKFNDPKYVAFLEAEPLVRLSEAATVIQTLQRSVHELEERVSALEEERQNLIATKREQIARLISRAEAAEQQVRDMIKRGFEGIDEDTRAEIIGSLSDIIRSALEEHNGK